MSSFPSKLKLGERHYTTEKHESKNIRWNTRMALRDDLKEEENDGDDNDNDSSEEKIIIVLVVTISKRRRKSSHTKREK